MRRGGHTIGGMIGSRIGHSISSRLASGSRRSGTTPTDLDRTVNAIGRSQDSQGASSYSCNDLSRQDSSSGFYLVDEEKPNRTQSLLESRSPNYSGDTVGRRVEQSEDPESEDAISDDALERLGMSDEYDCAVSKPSGGKEKKMWEIADKEVYEQQLMMLQEQLTSALIENHTLQSKLPLNDCSIPGNTLYFSFWSQME